MSDELPKDEERMTKLVFSPNYKGILFSVGVNFYFVARLTIIFDRLQDNQGRLFINKKKKKFEGLQLLKDKTRKKEFVDSFFLISSGQKDDH